MNGRSKIPNDIHPLHFLLHGATALVVFTVGIAADVAVVEWMHKRPRTVLWQAGELQKGYTPISNPIMPRSNAPCELGVMDDGTMVWRLRPKTTAKP